MRRLFLAIFALISVATPVLADGFQFQIQRGGTYFGLSIDGQSQYRNDDYLEGRVDGWQPPSRNRRYYQQQQFQMPQGYVNKSQYEKYTGQSCDGHQSHYMNARGEAVFICQP